MRIQCHEHETGVSLPKNLVALFFDTRKGYAMQVRIDILGGSILVK